MNTHVVIMAGGIGSRFWPLSTPAYPKQFIDVLGCGRTLIQLTVDRFKGLCAPDNFWVVTNAAYVGFIREQIPQIPENHILAEPAARNTAPCIAWACWRIMAEDPRANVIVTPSDAVVMNPEEYRRVIGNALAFTARHDAIVTIGIKPTRPETGYGYVETAAVCADAGADASASAGGAGVCSAAAAAAGACADASADADAPGAGMDAGPCEVDILPVARFKEKPDRLTAEAYLAAGNFLWNAGIFVWNIDTVTAALRKYSPGIAADMDRIMETGDVEGIFPKCEKISIDYAVMEPASGEGKVFTHPGDFGWSDLGNWGSLYDHIPHDAEGNAAVGNVRFYECRDCVVHLEDMERVALQGLEGYIVSGKDGRLLVCRRSEEQRIREFSQQ